MNLNVLFHKLVKIKATSKSRNKESNYIGKFNMTEENEIHVKENYCNCTITEASEI